MRFCLKLGFENCVQLPIFLDLTGNYSFINNSKDHQVLRFGSWLYQIEKLPFTALN